MATAGRFAANTEEGIAKILSENDAQWKNQGVLQNQLANVDNSTYWQGMPRHLILTSIQRKNLHQCWQSRKTNREKYKRSALKSLRFVLQ